MRAGSYTAHTHGRGEFNAEIYVQKYTSKRERTRTLNTDGRLHSNTHRAERAAIPPSFGSAQPGTASRQAPGTEVRPGRMSETRGDRANHGPGSAGFPGKSRTSYRACVSVTGGVCSGGTRGNRRLCSGRRTPVKERRWFNHHRSHVERSDLRRSVLGSWTSRDRGPLSCRSINTSLGFIHGLGDREFLPPS